MIGADRNAEASSPGKTATRKLAAKASAVLLGTVAFLAWLDEDLAAPFLPGNEGRRLSSPDPSGVAYVPSDLDVDSQRRLTKDLGGGKCKWGPPKYEVPAEINFHKTLIAGYPSGDKRMIFVQMEALTGWPAKDEWDFEYLGNSNHPFIKANYPHHEGVWGWGTNADQMVLMVRNIRRSMVEYYDIRWDLNYAESYEEVHALDLDSLYSERAPIEDFWEWRDAKVMDEIYWYGWEIDYWMEGGLMRDIFTHDLTSPDHWAMETNPGAYTRAELEEYYAANVAPGVADGSITASYDPHCDPANPDISDGCQPVAVISAEKLRSPSKGPSETEAIADVLLRDGRMSQYVANPSIFRCVWRELIVNKKGLKTVYDKKGNKESDYGFSEEMLTAMIAELDRLIGKYEGPEWYGNDAATTVVELLTEHRGEIQGELDDVQKGNRKLSAKDFLGPKERRKMFEAKGRMAHEKKDYSGYFDALDKKKWQERQEKRRMVARQQRRLSRKENREGGN